MNRSPLVFILILNYNGRATLPSCLRSIFHLNYPLFRVVVIDNASIDGSFEQAKKAYPKAHFIRNSENVGFARGMNVGIRFALDQRAEYLWLINPDAVIPKDSLYPLVSVLERHGDVGMVSPFITAPGNKSLWFGGGKISWLRMRAIHTPPRSHTMPFETGFLSGCAPLIKASVFRIVGLFDERFFLYYEDVDLSYRAKKSGFSAIVHPGVTITHSEESAKNPEKTYWLVRSGLLFFRKNMPLLEQPFFWTALALRKCWNILRIARHKKNKDVSALSVRDAFRDFWKYGY
ncbi:MAG: glycosyltransferase family 2 protein [Candidatus Moraniibacteriota bacterium]|nr:MAG: glycosyltransferase family 2 protein [Candidatus Moranbacteria bacterium]